MSRIGGSRIRRVAGVVSVFAAALAVASVHCSLGLDESRIDGQNADGGDAAVTDAPVAGDGGVVTTSDSGVPVGPDAGACTSDDGCKVANGCLTGKCDLTRKSCVYDVCRSSACHASICDSARKTCVAPAVAYKFKATQFSLSAPLACAADCAAAMYPWLFAILPTGLVAFNVSNPATATPPQVPIVGLDFIPARIVKTGARLWIQGSPSGDETTRISLAYIDVSADPFADKLVAQSVTATVNRPAAEGIAMLPRSGDTALLFGPAVSEFAGSIVQAPFAGPLVLTTTPLMFTAGTAPNAMSGKRLLMSAIAPGGVETFNLIDNAGGAGQVVGPATTLAETGLTPARTFAASTDGAIFMAQSVNEPGVIPTLSRTRAVRGYFLVPNATGPIDPTAAFDVEVYGVDAVTPQVAGSAAVVGPTAMLDAKTALVLAQARENPAQTAVQFVKREGPPGVIKEANTATPRRQLLPVSVTQIAAATASNGIAYVIANDDATRERGTVFVFDPACAP